ncbi:hypothetical protein [Xanthomonas arboricola]|uniref:hypothetical protein n=1 Tax=Xanthomonas arboricola TaxID=56448 RepID=UPI001CA59F6F|nr:hypothetical protein [Xanthomonas arboricola]
MSTVSPSAGISQPGSIFIHSMAVSVSSGQWNLIELIGHDREAHQVLPKQTGREGIAEMNVFLRVLAMHLGLAPR